MARKPAHIVATIAVRLPYGQDGVWRVIRELRHGDIKDILTRVAADRRTVTGYLDRLRKGGFVEALGDSGGWRLLVDQPETPRLRGDGSPAVETGRGQDNMWRSMKMLGEFSPRELAVAASTDDTRVTPAAAGSYIGHLHRAGYLHRVEEARTGSGRGQARYRLKPSMNTGPLAPQVQRTDWVWDPNTRKALAPETQGQGGRHAEP